MQKCLLLSVASQPLTSHNWFELIGLETNLATETNANNVNNNDWADSCKWWFTRYTVIRTRVVFWLVTYTGEHAMLLVTSKKRLTYLRAKLHGLPLTCRNKTHFGGRLPWWWTKVLLRIRKKPIYGGTLKLFTEQGLLGALLESKHYTHTLMENKDCSLSICCYMKLSMSVRTENVRNVTN